jgi:Pyridoxal/pyridoxine/pyridoxamine kinase
MDQKRIAAIHDISCFGRCSLTVALPILSAAGVETSVMPTAVLSTHTGGFEGYTFRDLTEDLLPIAAHWCALGLHFDAIYTGFLGSFEQIDIVSKVIDAIRSADTLVLVDPVMADNGRLYGLFPESFPSGMRVLCAKADVIVPNITEAALLTGQPYREGPYEPAYIEGLLARLAELGAGRVVLTGVYFDDKQLGAAVYDGGCTEYAMAERIPGFYHGTGDVFGSALLAGLTSGLSTAQAAQAAAEFTAGSIRRTHEAGTDIRYGVNFEAGLAKLAARLSGQAE